MEAMDTCSLRWVFFILMAISFSCCLDAQPFDYPSANLSTSWTNNPSITHKVDFVDGSRVRSILLRGTFGLSFACGFFCNGTCNSYLFAIFIVQTNSVSYIVSPALAFPQVVWSANPNNPVRENATLHLTQEGDLVLRDVDGSVAWSTNTSGKSVIGMNISDNGNLVLFTRNNSIVWQSFDHPTDSLVPGQKLVAGQRLTASVSTSNWTQVPLYLSVSTNGLFAFAGSNPPQAYSLYTVTTTKNSTKPSYVKFMNGSLAIFILSAEPDSPDREISVPLASSVQYMRLESDGHLRVHEWESGWKVVADLLTNYLGECSYPTVCGNYGICSNGQCSCPKGSNSDVTYFQPVNPRQPNLGCSEIIPLSCQSTKNHHLLVLQDISYFNYIDSDAAAFKGTDIESCKQACLNNCSCKAALFQYGSNISSGDCFLPSQIFSLMNNQREKSHYNSSAFIKVQIASAPPSSNPAWVGKEAPPTSRKKTSQTAKVVGSVLGAFFGAFLIVSICFALVRKRKDTEEEEDDCFNQVPGMPMRFAYEELRVATENFSKKLGEGGFGSVFAGTLGDGTLVAVKRLDNMGQGKREFLAEVETIGSIHHLNMVRLIGFCSEKSFRLLVYEYMCNGSLDKWIFCENQNPAFDWETRRKIITDIAKGLSYLHEECRQRIAHLDIKPQNILLDENFNAKISDFGLSKLIERDQSHVITRMRGTRGYLAPEWLSSKITEKVDVYSFGIVVLEIMCRRKNLDYSQSEENVHLLNIIKRKAEEDRLFEVVDKHGADMQLHEEEAVKMIKLAVWCLQNDFTRRPSMSMVVKVLEGVVDVEPSLNCSLLTSSLEITQQEVNNSDSAPLTASILSGPR